MSVTNDSAPSYIHTGQTCVYPLDVLRRRMQLGGGGASSAVMADTTWLALRQVVKQEGLKSLFSGIVPTYAKVIPAVAVAMTTSKELIGAYEKYV